MQAERQTLNGCPLDEAVRASFFCLSVSGAFIPGQPVFTAVSGGPDSVALCDVTERLCRETGHPHVALIVDHGLRTESADEALSVQARLVELGIEAVPLTVMVPPPLSGKLAWARQQRFALLTSYVRARRGILMFGHHRDDQAETVGMRLAHGSGFGGARGILPVRFFAGVLCVRPFLSISKQALVHYCKKTGLTSVADPSNNHRVYERVRMRALLDDEPHISGQLIRFSYASHRLSKVLQRNIQAFSKRYCRSEPLMTCIDLTAFQRAPLLLRLQLIKQTLMRHGAPDYPPSEASVTKAIQAVFEGRQRTLAGCLLRCRRMKIQIGPEFGRQDVDEVICMPDEFVLFDKRWLIHSTHQGRLMRLGRQGWATRDRHEAFFQALETLPAAFGQMIPVLHGLDGREVTPHFETCEAFLPLYQGKLGHNSCLKGSNIAPKLTVFSLHRLNELFGALITIGQQT